MVSVPIDPVIDSLAHHDKGIIDPRRLADLLHVTMGDLADMASLHRTTLARNIGSPEVQSRLGPIATILSRAADMSGGLGKAVLWFRHQPIAALGQKRAADLVRTGEANAVLAWLDALEDGACTRRKRCADRAKYKRLVYPGR